MMIKKKLPYGYRNSLAACDMKTLTCTQNHIITKVSTICNAIVEHPKKIRKSVQHPQFLEKPNDENLCLTKRL